MVVWEPKAPWVVVEGHEGIGLLHVKDGPKTAEPTVLPGVPCGCPGDAKTRHQHIEDAAIDECVEIGPNSVRELHDLVDRLQLEAVGIRGLLHARQPCDRLRQLLLHLAALQDRVGCAEAILLAQHLQVCLPAEFHRLHALLQAVNRLSRHRMEAL